MRNNYKIYRKYKRKRYNVVILLLIVFLFVICISVGYSAWNATLNINTSITLASNKEFQVSPIDEDIIDEYIISTISSNDATLESQILEDNKLTITYEIIEKTGTPRSPQTSFSIKNNSAYPLTNITTSYTVTGDINAIDGTITISIPQSVPSGDSANVIITTPLKLNKLNTSVTVMCTINYTVNNVQKSFYVEFIYHK